MLAAGLPCTAEAQSCVLDTTPDWTESTSSSAQVRPADCAVVEQTPPDFSWPDLSPDAQYQIRLTYPDGSTRSATVMRNWINWDEILPAGSYTWQVQVSNASGTWDSRPRRFTVDAAAVAFVVPDWNILFQRAAAKPHPRALPDAATLATMLQQRQVGLTLLLHDVDSKLADAVPPEPGGTSQEAIEVATLAACRLALNAAFAWVATGREEHLADALRRAASLASWDPRGATSYANVDQAARLIAWTLTLAYDWIFPRLDGNQKSLLLDAIMARANDIYSDLIGGRARVAVHPYDSHGNHTLTFLAVIAVLLAGDVAEAQIGVRDALPLALHWTSPWGGEDGGFGNGTFYAGWDTGDKLVPWYVLRWAVGVDIAQKAWVRNHARYLAYFVPPGTPSGSFGDGAEQQLAEYWARLGKGYTAFAPSPLGRWYARQLAGEDQSRLELLLAPLADPSPAPLPSDTPNAMLFASIGWVAMHSDLTDAARTSVYFKSSPYGSYNHSHADQNSFVINAGGERLAIGSGYYDGYQTPHWSQWYKQTRAHNAITYDGGQGQVVFEQGGRLGAGAITGYFHRPDHDIVHGDATQAYGDPPNGQARRSLVYLRPNHVLVYDKLAAGLPIQWEWNIHAVNAINAISDQQISIANNGMRLCVDMLAAPPLRFTQTDSFTADPVVALPRQWHGTFYSVDRLAATEFIALLRVGCAATTASAVKTDGAWTVDVGPRRVTIDGGGAITVR
jgi:Heparinase II/III-like protein/Domain of unknown function (DUF4962)